MGKFEVENPSHFLRSMGSAVQVFRSLCQSVLGIDTRPLLWKNLGVDLLIKLTEMRSVERRGHHFGTRSFGKKCGWLLIAEI
ncbi:unnamed protein product [Larinioides sclopetarius]|uniref:Uncharacterized protein n=1 Tax=Larinioides sclopetarius TaxID=280406 RepID=A0AAV2B2Q7_9ARAC